MTLPDNPHHPPQPQSESPPNDEAMRRWSSRQPLSWKISSAIGLVLLFAGCFAGMKYLDLSSTGWRLAIGGLLLLCILPSAFFNSPRYHDKPVRNWLHALTPIFVVFVLIVVITASHWWGGKKAADLVFIIAVLASALISLKLSQSKKESRNDAR